MLKKYKKALTLVEMIVALSILSLAITGIYGSFSMGVRVYKIAEEGLDRTQELRVFMMFLRRELRNIVKYDPVAFEGKKGEITFPARITRYTDRGKKENLYIVRYKIQSGQIIREEELLRKKAGGGKEKRKFVVLDRIRLGQFSFPFKEEDTRGVLWRDTWDPEDKLGIPNALRLRMQLLPRESTSKRRASRHKASRKPAFFEEIFYIPQGGWGKFE